MNLVRRDLKNLAAYIAGKPIPETQRELGLEKVYKLASNENPLGVSPKAIKAIQKALREINRYPDSQSFYLKKRLAQEFKLSPNNFVLGNGSDELIDVIIKTFVENNETILTANTTFLEYRIISKVNGRRIHEVPLKDFTYDLEKIRKRVNNKTKLIFIANPNNPTGTYVNKKELINFIKSLPAHTITVLDEAYDTFIDVNDFPKSVEWIRNKNIIVLKTFSKAFGLAGLRIGFAVAKPELTQYMEKVRQPFNLNSLAQAASVSALDDRIFLSKTKKNNLTGKKYLYRELAKIPVTYIPSVANFILVDTRLDCFLVFKQLLKKGIIVRDMKQYGLDTFIRVTIGTGEENKSFISALKEVIMNQKRIN
ncbi:MAG: histidinol-phosphate transaminase [Candidatus Omnitrophota bacterium]